MPESESKDKTNWEKISVTFTIKSRKKKKKKDQKPLEKQVCKIIHSSQRLTIFKAPLSIWKDVQIKIKFLQRYNYLHFRLENSKSCQHTVFRQMRGKLPLSELLLRMENEADLMAKNLEMFNKYFLSKIRTFRISS